MENLYIKVGSITNAQRGQSLLRSRGYKPMIRKIEKPNHVDGCGYAIEVSGDKEEIIRLFIQKRIAVKEVEVL